MHQIGKSTFQGSVILALSLLAFLSVAISPRHAEAQNRGEDYITGRSLSDFSGMGHIDSIDEDKMVIDDCSRELSSGVKYYKPGPKKISKSAFAVGSRVGYVEDRNGDIISLWLLPRAKTRK
jgi:hypothetical protein